MSSARPNAPARNRFNTPRAAPVFTRSVASVSDEASGDACVHGDAATGEYLRRIQAGLREADVKPAYASRQSSCIFALPRCRRRPMTEEMLMMRPERCLPTSEEPSPSPLRNSNAPFRPVFRTVSHRRVAHGAVNRPSRVDAGIADGCSTSSFQAAAGENLWRPPPPRRWVRDIHGHGSVPCARSARISGRPSPSFHRARNNNDIQPRRRISRDGPTDPRPAGDDNNLIGRMTHDAGR